MGLVLAWGKDAEGIEGERALELLMLKQIEKSFVNAINIEQKIIFTVQ